MINDVYGEKIAWKRCKMSIMETVTTSGCARLFGLQRKAGIGNRKVLLVQHLPWPRLLRLREVAALLSPALNIPAVVTARAALLQIGSQAN